MRRGEVYDATLEPTRGSEQAGFRPVIIVSHDAINAASSVVIVIPCTTYREGRRVYPSQVLIKASEGGLEADSVALGNRYEPCPRAGSDVGGERCLPKPSLSWIGRC